MRTLCFSMLCSVLLLVAACSSPDRRISSQQAVFNTYPSDVQQKIRAGQVAIGFTPEMVRMALGEPARKFNRRSQAGDTEVWSYDYSGPRFSLGLGVGSGGGGSGVGGGVGVSTGGHDPDEKIRIEFRDGKVSGIDEMKK